jgi:hypothetical protein
MCFKHLNFSCFLQRSLSGGIRLKPNARLKAGARRREMGAEYFKI